jgi:hypothetical protein
MSTFAEIAQEARLVATSQRPGSIDYARMIARLAEALDRFEYNVARMFAVCEPRQTPLANIPTSIAEALSVLRAERHEEVPEA